MNERIKELAAKAGMHYYRKGKLQQDAEKFAELIVLECAGLNFRHGVGLTHDDDYEISNLIKRHFGIE